MKTDDPREKECFSKHRYTTEAHANVVARAAEAKRGTPLRVYACRHCGGWHLSRRTEWIDRPAPTPRGAA